MNRDDEWLKIWCRLNAHLSVDQFIGREVEIMKWIEKRFGLKECLIAWRTFQYEERKGKRD